MVVYPSCPIISFYFSTNPKLKMSTTSAKMSAEPLHLLDPARPQLSQQKNLQPRKNSKKSDTRKEKYLNSECSFTSLQNRRSFGGRVLSIILGKSWLPSLIFTAVKGWERNLYQGGEWRSKEGEERGWGNEYYFFPFPTPSPHRPLQLQIKYGGWNERSRT